MSSTILISLSPHQQSILSFIYWFLLFPLNIEVALVSPVYSHTSESDLIHAHSFKHHMLVSKYISPAQIFPNPVSYSQLLSWHIIHVYLTDISNSRVQNELVGRHSKIYSILRFHRVLVINSILSVIQAKFLKLSYILPCPFMAYLI